MLYMPGGKQIARVHGPFVSDEEVRAVADHWRGQGTPEYNMAVTEEPEDGGYIFEGQPMGDDDAETQLYKKAVQTVAASQRRRPAQCRARFAPAATTTTPSCNARNVQGKNRKKKKGGGR